VGFIQQRRNHRRRRCFAMGARNRDGPFKAHQFGKHVGALDHRDMTRARGGDFRIVALDRGRNDHRVCAFDVLRLVADHHRHALVAQALNIGPVRNVRAAHIVTERPHHIGDAAHADAANADKMHNARAEGQAHLDRRRIDFRELVCFSHFIKAFYLALTLILRSPASLVLRDAGTPSQATPFQPSR